MIIALEGPRSVGKTTLINKINKANLDIITHEGFYIKDTPKIITSEMEFYENQKIYINQKINQYIDMKYKGNHLVVRGIENILEYTLNYPLIHGYEWDVQKNMKNEIEAMSTFKSDKILYLDASKDVLIERNSNDKIRNRENLTEWIELWSEKMKSVFLEYSYTQFIDTDRIAPEEVLSCIIKLFDEEKK